MIVRRQKFRKKSFILESQIVVALSTCIAHIGRGRGIDYRDTGEKNGVVQRYCVALNWREEDDHESIATVRHTTLQHRECKIGRLHILPEIGFMFFVCLPR